MHHSRTPSVMSRSSHVRTASKAGSARGPSAVSQSNRMTSSRSVNRGQSVMSMSSQTVQRDVEQSNMFFTVHTREVWAGHSNSIYHLILCRDGALISVGGDSCLRVWQKGECINVLRGHAKQLRCAIECSDGAIVSGSDDCTLRVWDRRAGHCMNVLIGHSSYIAKVIECRDGSIVSASDDSAIRVWNKESSQCLKVLQGHSTVVSCILESQDGYIVSGGDKDLRIWNKDNGKCLQVLRGHNRMPTCIIECRDGTFVSGSLDKTIRVWDRRSCLKVLKGHSYWITDVLECQDGILISSSLDKTIRVWNKQRSVCIRVLEGHCGAINCLLECRNGVIISGSDDRTLCCWSRDNGELINVFEGHSAEVLTVVEHFDGSIVSAGTDKTLRRWRTECDLCIDTLYGHNGPVHSVIECRNGTLASGGEDQLVMLWQRGRVHQVFRGHTASVNCLVECSNGIIVSGSDDNLLIAWSRKPGEELRQFKGHTHWVTSVLQTDDGYVVSGSRDCTCKVWNLDTGECLFTFEEHGGSVYDVFECKDGSILSAGLDTRMLKWKKDSGEVLVGCDGHSFAVNQCIECVDGSLVSAAEDNFLRVFDGTTGEAQSVLEGHWTQVTCVIEYQPGLLVSGSKDGTVRIWDKTQGYSRVIKLLINERGHRGLGDATSSVLRTPTSVRCLVKCRDGTLITANDNEMSMWSLVPLVIERDDADTFEDLLQNGLDIDSLCHSLNTFDFFEFLTSNDKMNIAELFKAHEKHLDSAEMRIASALKPENDLWACEAAPLGFMKFPTEMIFADGDPFDGGPKVGFVLYDTRFAGRTEVGAGGQSRVYIFSPDNLPDNDLPIHINAYNKAFGELPGPMPRAEFTYDVVGENDLILNDKSIQNAGLYYSYNKKLHEQMQIPAPLFLQLQFFLKTFYENGVLPDSTLEYSIIFQPRELNHAWYKYSKQLQSFSHQSFHHYEDTFGPINHDVVDELSKRLLVIENKLDESEKNSNPNTSIKKIASPSIPSSPSSKNKVKKSISSPNPSSSSYHPFNINKNNNENYSENELKLETQIVQGLENVQNTVEKNLRKELSSRMTEIEKENSNLLGKLESTTKENQKMKKQLQILTTEISKIHELLEILSSDVAPKGPSAPPSWWSALPAERKNEIEIFLQGREYEGKLIQELADETNLQKVDCRQFLQWWFRQKQKKKFASSQTKMQEDFKQPNQDPKLDVESESLSYLNPYTYNNTNVHKPKPFQNSTNHKPPEIIPSSPLRIRNHKKFRPNFNNNDRNNHNSNQNKNETINAKSPRFKLQSSRIRPTFGM